MNFSGIEQGAETLARGAVRTITIRTALNPDNPIVINDPFAPSSEPSPASGIGGALLDWLKPEISISGAAGAKTLAPAGSPDDSNARMWIALAAVLGAGALALVVARLVRGKGV